MHLHFTQSLEPLQGAGLGGSALGLHQGLLEAGLASRLVATRGGESMVGGQGSGGSGQSSVVRGQGAGVGDPGNLEPKTGVTEYRRRGPAKLFYAPELGREAARLVKDAQWLHGHGFYVYLNAVLGRAARRRRKPLVYHVHGFLDPWILRRSRLKKRIAHWLFENANFRHVAWWRALSEKEAGQIRDYGVRAPIEIIPNGVHLPEERTEPEIRDLLSRFPLQREKRLLFLSRIHPKKGLDLLVQAWARLDQSVTRDWEIAVFGPDEGGHLSEIKTLVDRSGIAESVSFHGSVSGLDKDAAYRSADLFVLPSRSEGFPMAVLEAASYGLPVVQTDECNFPELTKAGGAWEASPSVESLQKALKQALHADTQELRERGAAGRALVERDYQWRAIAEQLNEACRKYCG